MRTLERYCVYTIERKYETPEFAEFPESEYQKRQRIAQKYMNENAVGQDHAFCISVFQLFGDPSLKIGGYLK